jgi:cardiolipin synthase
LLGLAVLQLLLYRVLAPSDAPWDPFLLGVTLFHVAVGSLLFWRHEEFTPLDSAGRRAVAHLTLPNVLTLLRLSSIPTLTLLLAVGPRPGTVPVLVALAAGVFLTDLFDGALARRWRQVTPIGGYLDSGSDYLVLLALTVLLAAQGILPFWLALLLTLRLVLHALAMGVLVLRRGIQVAKPTTWGKVSVAAAMVLITLELLAHAAAVLQPRAGPALLLARGLQVAELLTALLIGISLVDKLHYFLHTLGAARRTPPAPPGNDTTDDAP